MIWPPAFCQVVSCVTRGPEYAFRMHGLWPADVFGRSRQNCRGTAYDKSQISPRRRKTKKCWIGFSMSNDELWEEQWIKHGRCSPLTQKIYFRKGHSVCDALSRDLMDALSSRGILRRQDYAILRYYDAIYDYLNVYPEIMCKTAGKMLLYEIRICYSLSFHRINCTQRKISPDCFSSLVRFE
ncbi:hypothetical protein RND81_07G197000 [Saponaria officinalis]